MSDVELPEPSELVDRYEALRAAALEGEPVLVDGLALFYQRGMWAWAQSAAPRPATCPSPSAPVPIEVSPTHSQAAFARILARMALGNPTVGSALS